MEKSNPEKPFSFGYVMRTTIKHLQKSVDVSIKKTLDRIEEFKGDEEKSREVFNTLATLHSIKNVISDFQLQYKTEQ